MARVLVVCYSRSGTTKKAGAAIAKALGADFEVIVDRASRAGIRGYLRSGYEATFQRETQIERPARDAEDYDLVVLGTPVWNASLSSPMLTYIRQHMSELGEVAFFCTCGGRGGERVLAQMARETGRTATATLILREAEVAHDTIAPKVDRFVRALRATLETAPSGRVGSAPSAGLHA